MSILPPEPKLRLVPVVLRLSLGVHSFGKPNLEIILIINLLLESLMLAIMQPLKWGLPVIKIVNTFTVAALVTFSSAISFAANSLGVQYIRQINTSSCYNWSILRDTSGMTAYACSSYPMSYTALDGNDTLRVISQLENRISQLEEQVKELSKK